MSDENETSAAPAASSPPHDVVVVGADSSPVARRLADAAIAVSARPTTAADVDAILDGESTGLEGMSDEELAKASEAEDKADEKTGTRRKRTKKDPDRQVLPVLPHEAWKYAKGSHKPCNGQGFLRAFKDDPNAVPYNIDPTDKSKVEWRKTCPCAVNGLKKAHPDLVTINGHLFWPPKDKAEPVAIPDVKESSMETQMREAKEAERERKLAHVARLRKEADEAEAAAKAIEQEIAALVGPEQAQLKELHEGDNALVTSLAALADGIREAEEKSRTASGQIVDLHNETEQEIARIRREAEEAVGKAVAARTAKRAELEILIADLAASCKEDEEHRARIFEQRKGLKAKIAQTEEEITKKAGKLRRKQNEKAREVTQLRVRADRIEVRNRAESNGT